MTNERSSLEAGRKGPSDVTGGLGHDEAKIDLGEMRGDVLNMVAAAGDIAGSMAVGASGMDCGGDDKKCASMFERGVTMLLGHALNVAAIAGVNLYTACMKKFDLNDRKYPAKLCSDAKIEKWTEMSGATGVEKTNQALDGCFNIDESTSILLRGGLSEIRERSYDFVRVRGWQHLDTQLSLCLAVCSEVGEVADLVAWKGGGLDVASWDGFRNRMAQELADVIIILVRLSENGGTDLCNAGCLLEEHGFVLRERRG